MQSTNQRAQRILRTAIQALNEESGFNIQITESKPPLEGQPATALLRLGERERWAVIKPWAQHISTGVLIQLVNQLPTSDGLLVADRIDPKLASRLRAAQIQFIDTAGNAYIHQPGVHIHVTGKRLQVEHPPGIRPATNPAFEPRGLQVVFALLCQPHLVRAPYRQIAHQAGVSLGTVQRVLHALKEAGYLQQYGARANRNLLRHNELLQRWVQGFAEKLQPRLFRGRFISERENWWQHADLSGTPACWGGEIAATHYTNQYLKPQIATLYLPDYAESELFRQARLRQDNTHTRPDGHEVRIYRPFWPEPSGLTPWACSQGLVHPVLVYAELIASGDSRNLEAAQIIHEQHLAGHLRQS